MYLLGSGADQPDSVEHEMRGRVRDNAIPNIVFVGDTARPEDYLGVADLFLFPSRREGFPNAVLEAMSAGAAVIASNIGGCADLIRSGETGILVEPDVLRPLRSSLMPFWATTTPKPGSARRRGGMYWSITICQESPPTT